MFRQKEEEINVKGGEGHMVLSWTWNLWSTGAFRDSGAGAGVGAGLGNFWKRWVRVRRDSAIKKLLKIFLFIFSIYFYY